MGNLAVPFQCFVWFEPLSSNKLGLGAFLKFALSETKPAKDKGRESHYTITQPFFVRFLKVVGCMKKIWRALRSRMLIIFALVAFFLLPPQAFGY